MKEDDKVNRGRFMDMAVIAVGGSPLLSAWHVGRRRRTLFYCAMTGVKDGSISIALRRV